MSILEVVNGTARDGVRAAAMAAMRLRRDISGELFSPAMITDPYPMYRRLREMGAAIETTTGTISTNYAVCNEILRDPQTTTAVAMGKKLAGGTSRFQQWLFTPPNRDGLIEPVGPYSMIGLDAPDHTRLRRLAARAITARRIEQLRTRLTEIAHELVGRARQEPSFDLMTEVAGVLPVRAICELLGIPQLDHERFRRWGTAIAVDLDAMAPAHRQREATRAIRSLNSYFEELLAKRRADPTDDLISELIAAEESGDRLSSKELMGMCMLLLFAGFETTVNLIGNATLALIKFPDQLQRLRADLTLVRPAIEEFLRFDAPIQVTARIPGRELSFDDVVLPAGEPVSLILGGANHDPEVFETPEQLDIARPDARQHLAFATGPHHCLGAALARLEGEICFAVLLEQLGDLRLAGEPKRRSSFVLRGLTRLPLQSLAK